MSKGDFTDFLNALRAFESGVDYDRYLTGQITEAQIRSWVGDANWNAYKIGQLTWHDMQYTSVNALGFVGYQFGEALLNDLGYYKGNTGNQWTGTFTGKNGVDNFTELKTDIQEAIILDAFGFNLNVIESGLAAKGTSLDALIGTARTYKDTNGQDVTVTLTMTGILAAAHLRGAWGTLDLLNNGSASADEYGTSILKYIQQFGAYDSPAASIMIAAYTSGKTLSLAEELWHDDFNNDGVISDYSGWDGTQIDGGSSGTGGGGTGGGGGGTGGGTGDGVATVTTINWSWGANTVLAFEPANDVLDFGWFQADNFSIAEVGGSVVITIVGNNQTYTLSGVSLAQLSMANIRAKDASAVSEWDAAFDSAVPAAPTIAVSDATVAEGNSGTAQLVFTITLSKAATGPVTVQYATTHGTATAGTDYTAATGTVTFAAGETSKTVSIAVKGDTTVEGNETVTLKLTDATGATIADASGTGTITNDDVAPTLPAISIADVTVAEGNSGTTQASFVVTLSKAATGPVTVTYSTANGTAAAGSDYTAATGTVTFAAGETSKTVNVAITGDTSVEANETFTVNLANASGATISKAAATGTITNDDVVVTPPAISIVDMSLAEGNTGTTQMSFVVTLSKAATGPVTVNYSTANGTATSGSDYTAATGTVTFAAGETSKTVNVAITGDTAVEANETFTVNLANASGATIARATATGTITNDDVSVTPPTISIVDVTVAEGNSGTTQATFVVTLSKAATGPVTVAYSTANGTATSGSDYTAATGTLTFAAGETSKTVSVAVKGDTTVEANETFTVNLANASGATIAKAAATGTITNDDAAPANSAVLDYTVATNWGTGFTGSMAVEAGATAINGWTVEFDASFNITSIWNAEIVSHVGNHYVIRNVSWNGAVAANKETAFGFSATTTGSATAATGFLINGAPSGSGGFPAISIGDVAIAEGNSGTSNLSFTVTLDKAATGPVTVAYSTANGTATAGSDYTAATGTVTFAAGETSKTIQIKVTGDTSVEANETFTVNLANASGATIAKAAATGTITNDDVAVVLPAISVADMAVVEGNGEHSHFMFTVTLDKAATGPVTVNYATANGTATGGSDFVAGSGTVTFAAGETSKTVHVDIIGDTSVEANETFTLNLSSPSGATIARGTATGTITNDDIAAALPAISIGDMAVTEGNGEHVHFMFTVTLDRAATGPVTVNYATANGTATAGSDYVAGTGTVTFAAGETSKTIHVDIVGDTVVEANETFTVNLSGASGATIARPVGTGTITNDDGAPAVPTIQVADVSMREGNSGSAEMMFVVTLSQAATGTVTVNYSTANGTATSGYDYTALSGTLTFTAGQTSQMIHVMVNGDTGVEANETFTLNLSNAVGATIADASAIGTITDDDTVVDPGTGPGKTYTITSLSVADVVGFNPAVDVIDLGNANIHSFIIIDTPQGVGFASPWNSETVIIQGVRLADLTVDNFAYIDNNHLREALSGALAWENGPALEAHTVYMRSHEVGQVDKVAFDPAVDVVSFKYYGSREQLSMADSAEGVVITDGTTGQKLVLLGVDIADLAQKNFEFTFTQVREDDLSNKIGMGNAANSQIVDFDIPIAGGGTVAGASGSHAGVLGEDDHTDHDHSTMVATTAVTETTIVTTTETTADTVHTHGTEPCPDHSGHLANGVADTTSIAWAWGANKVVDFDTALDTLDFGWMGKDSFSVAEVNGSTVITIEGNSQTYTLTDVSLVELSLSNIAAKDAGALAEWTSAIGAAKAANECECCLEAAEAAHDHIM